MKNSWWFVFILFLGLCFSPGCGDEDRNPGASSVSSAASDTTPPVISEIGVSQKEDSVEVKWLTDEPATSQVQYGTSAKTGFFTEEDKNLVTRHEITLDSLEKGVVYYLKAISRDADGNPSVSEAQTAYLPEYSTARPEEELKPEGKGTLNISISPPVALFTLSLSTPDGKDGPMLISGMKTDGYEFTDLLPGIYNLEVTFNNSSQYFHYFENVLVKNIYAVSEKTTEVEINLTPLPTAGSISGKITPIGAKATVTAVMAINNSTWVGESITREDGTYHIIGLAPGTYNLVVKAEGWADDKSMKGIVVSAGEESSGHNLSLQKTGSISGKVSPAGSEAVVHLLGEDIYREKDLEIVHKVSEREVKINDNGEYRIVDLSPGEYDLAIVAPGYKTDWSLKGIIVKEGVESTGYDAILVEAPSDEEAIRQMIATFKEAYENEDLEMIKSVVEPPEIIIDIKYLFDEYRDLKLEYTQIDIHIDDLFNQKDAICFWDAKFYGVSEYDGQLIANPLDWLSWFKCKQVLGMWKITSLGNDYRNR